MHVMQLRISKLMSPSSLCATSDSALKHDSAAVDTEADADKLV